MYLLAATRATIHEYLHEFYVVLIMVATIEAADRLATDGSTSHEGLEKRQIPHAHRPQNFRTWPPDRPSSGIENISHHKIYLIFVDIKTLRVWIGGYNHQFSKSFEQSTFLLIKFTFLFCI